MTLNPTPLAQALAEARLVSPMVLRRAVWMSPFAFWMAYKGLRFKHRFV